MIKGDHYERRIARPCSKSSQYAQRRQRWSNDSSKELQLHLLLGYADRNESVWRKMAKRYPW